MYKYLFFLIVPLFLCFGTPSEASPNDDSEPVNLIFEAKKRAVNEERNAIQMQISILKTELTTIEDETQKGNIIDNIVTLATRDKKLADFLSYESQRLDVIEQRKAIKKEIKKLKGELESLNDEDDREPIINSIIELTMIDNKFAANEKAYTQALGLDKETSNSEIYFSVSSADMLPGQFVPTSYIPLYKSAEKTYGVEWELLAAIHKVETDYSRIKNMVSYAGAQGHMQFMPQTFKAYGVDANGNGTRSPWELEDAVFSAANYLSVSGANKDVRGAIWHYNHSDSYIDKVLGIADTIKGVAD